MNKLATQSLITHTFSENLYHSWLEFLDVSENTERTYASAGKSFMCWLQQEEITSPNRQDVLRYKKHLLETKSAATAQLHLVVVRLLFEFLAQENLYPNIATHIKSVKSNRSFKRDYLTSDQARRLLASIQSRGAEIQHLFRSALPLGLE